MEKKGRKANFKKFIAMICIFVILQSYFSYFAQIAIATSEAVIGSGETQEEPSNEEQSADESEDPVIDEEQDESVAESEESEEAVIDEEENPAEEPVQEEQQEEPAVEEDPQEEPVIEEEPYVEPEVTIEVTSENSSIYKGYLYANATSDLRYATNYNTIDTVTIVGGKNMTSLTVQDESDKIQLITNDKIGLMSQMYYRQTRISVDEFNSILGAEGSIKLYTPEGEEVGFINKDSEIIDEEYVFTYPMQLNSVKFEFTNMIADGTISIKNDKVIKESSDFSRNQISLFSTINTITQANVYIGEEVKTYSAEGNINLEETESRMVIDVDTDTLSVEGKNEVAINVTLKTDEERYDLFENPTIDLEFPSAVEDVEVTGVTLLYRNGLSIDNWEVITNSVGRKVLKVSLSGSQLEYTPGAVQEGTTVVVYTDVNVNRLTADTSEALRMTYTNKDTIRKTYSLEGKDSEDINFDFVGRQELVRAMEITSNNEETVTSYDETIEKIQISSNEEQTVVIRSAIVNNYEATLNDVVIIGRIPFVGNKDGNGNDLGTNFDSKLQNAISTSGVIADVYYSEDGTATASSDSWTQDLNNLNDYKSYKIVVREKTLAKGEKLSFEYNLTIPQEVGYNAKGYSNYVVNYKIDTQNYSNQCSVGMYTEEKEIDMNDIKEDARQEVATLTVGTQVSQGGTVLGESDTVYERQILKYTIVVRNTSNITANNVVIRANAENANLYDWEYISTGENYFEGIDTVRKMKEFSNEEREFTEFTIDSLKPGESKTFEYEVIVKELSEIGTPEVYGNIVVSVDGYTNTEIITLKNEVKEANIQVLLRRIGTESVRETENTTRVSVGLNAEIKNITNKDLKNVEYVVNLPNNVSLYENMITFDNKDTDVQIEKIVDNATKIIFTIPELKVGETNNIYFYIQNKSMDYTVYSSIMTITSYIKSDDEVIDANDYTRKIYQGNTKIEYLLTSDIDKEYVENNDQIVFTLNAKNIGFTPSEIIKAVANIPSGLEVIDIQFDNLNTNNFKNYNNEKINALLYVNQNEQQNLIITTKVNENLFERDQKLIEFGMDITNIDNELIKTNIISYKINNSFTSYNEEEIDDDDEDELEEIFSENNNSNNSNNNQNDNNDNNTPEVPQEQPSTNQSNNDNNNTNNNSQNRTTQAVRTYYISGLAWIDMNQDGIRQSSEQPKEAVIARLFKANSNGGLDTSSVVAETATDSDGQYTFSSVEPGNYIVVFDYNSSKYKVTKYQVDTATSTENSDAISKTVTIDGESQLLGVTDVLTVEASSLISIDIGLVDKTNFDLSLEKGIASVKVKNDSGTKVYNYQNGTNARLEIRSKYYKSTVLDITYNFKIKNEGEVAGYVNKVVDYLPDDVQVNLNSSPDWYIGSDNGLYYTGLVDQEIQPGETKEFTLVIRKSLENGEAVKLVNGAEIVEATNAQGLFDRDSIENNKMQSEDDYGVAILTVSISTGHTVQYITTILLIIIMISAIVMMEIKYKNTKKVYR